MSGVGQDWWGGQCTQLLQLLPKHSFLGDRTGSMLMNFNEQ